MEMNIHEIGSMVGGISADLGRLTDTTGAEHVVLLQYGGEMPNTVRSSARVNGVWVKAPPSPPSKAPLITMMPAGGGPRTPIEASAFIENARCKLGFMLPSVWADSDPLCITAAEVARIAKAIEEQIPECMGGFAVAWSAAEDQPDYIPF